MYSTWAVTCRSVEDVALDPLHQFITLLAHTGYSYSLLLDLLMSPETLFLVYLLKTLKHISQHWAQWIHACDSFHNSQSALNDTLTAVNHHTLTCGKKKRRGSSESTWTFTDSEDDSCSLADTRHVIGQKHLLVGGASSAKRVIVEYSSSSDEDNSVEQISSTESNTETNCTYENQHKPQCVGSRDDVMMIEKSMATDSMVTHEAAVMDIKSYDPSPSCERLASDVASPLCRAMCVLRDLTRVLARLVTNDVFPFDIRPLMTHLHRCQHLYSHHVHTSS